MLKFQIFITLALTSSDIAYIFKYSYFLHQLFFIAYSFTHNTRKSIWSYFFQEDEYIHSYSTIYFDSYLFCQQICFWIEVWMLVFVKRDQKCMAQQVRKNTSCRECVIIVRTIESSSVSPTKSFNKRKRKDTQNLLERRSQCQGIQKL